MPPSAARPRQRIEVIDLARGLALVAMATYHLAWDLEFFGYLETGISGRGPLKIYARLIAGSFLFLAGLSLVLAHWPEFRRSGFLRRLAMVAAAALAITIGTWLAVPDSFIFFGILHAIAAGSLLGLMFLRLPSLLTLAFAFFFLALPQFYRAGIFDSPWLWWVGLSATVPRSNDYVPLFPWFGAMLAGMAAGHMAISTRLTEKLALFKASGNTFGRILTLAGRHSLAVYLVHQPVLIALVWSVSQVAPPPRPDPVEAYTSQCERACVQSNDLAMCRRFCGCVLDELMARDLFTPLEKGEVDPATDPTLGAIAAECTRLSRLP